MGNRQSYNDSKPIDAKINTEIYESSTPVYCKFFDFCKNMSQNDWLPIDFAFILCYNKSQCKKKVQFPNEASLERFICGIVLEYNRESEERIHKGFALAQAQLTDLFI